jgi:DNA-directed RNA polymerase subunit M/transcription elongation factor TFIIS
MIIRCPDCHFMMIQADGCRNCGFSYSQKEANDQKDKRVSRKVEKPTGEIMHSPAGQLSLNLS